MRRVLAALRVAALSAVAVGAVGSAGFVINAGRRNPSRLLIAGFVFWVVSPFVLLGLAHARALRWSIRARLVLESAIVTLTAVTLGIYANAAFGPRRPQGAFVFVIVPPISWLAIAAVVWIAAIISRRRP
jgi:hypothetical protein